MVVVMGREVGHTSKTPIVCDPKKRGRDHAAFLQSSSLEDDTSHNTSSGTPTATALPLLSDDELPPALAVKGYVGIRVCAFANPGNFVRVAGIVGGTPESASDAMKTRSVVGQGYTTEGRNSNW
eukprot:CAMPEP_0198270032 /NCGR_PEP_ID=MMETSP1447-20131203/43545_1 /TAXON_ID=420782 /ORGANISM="Chaetoceros dichaeta, Strain CCMP1751" /LENGTH=123 /DNA_ID=CAMNT_0043961887 /DNA_START=233 /DNA_END=601 /DNA_ORIENTATION=+